MAEAIAIAAQPRERAGKGAARATRRAGKVPAVIYGNNIDPEMISLDPLELNRELHRTGFFSRIFEVDVAGKKVRVLARDVQFHPVSDRPLHVDFMRFGANTRLHVDVNVVFVNEDKCPGLKRGGVLNIVRHTVELVCKADSIPESLVANLEGLDIGDGIHISHISLPEGVRPAIADRDFTVATIAAPTVAVAEDEVKPAAEGEAAATGEKTAEAGKDGKEGKEGA